MFGSRTKSAAVVAALVLAFSLDGAQGATRPLILGHGKRFVYAALRNSVAVFTTGDRFPTQIGSITTGAGAPGGIFADSSRLYVANNNPVSVSVYLHGDTVPEKILTVPRPRYGLGQITVGRDGTIYVATLNGNDAGDQFVYEFPPGHRHPSSSLIFKASGPPVYVNGLAVDYSNRLYVDWGSGTTCCPFGLTIFNSGSTSGYGTKFGLSDFGGDVMTTPHGFIAVGIANEYARNTYSRIEIGQLPHPEEHPTYALDIRGYAFSLDPMFHLLYVIAKNGTLKIHRFVTGERVGDAPGFSGAHAVAVEPPPT